MNDDELRRDNERLLRENAELVRRLADAASTSTRAEDHERKRLGVLFAKAPALIAAVRGKDHVFEFANEAYAALTGRHDVIGKTIAEVRSTVPGGGLTELLDRVLETGEPFIADAMPLTMTRPGALPEQRYVNFVYQPIVEPDGSRSGVFLHGVDVTDITIAQQRIRAQFHGIPVPTYVFQRVDDVGEKQFVLLDVNKAALTISNGAIAALIGRPASECFADVPEIADEIARCLERGPTTQREIERTLATGEKRRFFVTFAAAPPDLVIVHTADVTERVKLEHQLRQSQKMEAVGQLAGGVAHDFNNLLTVILSYTGMALQDLKPGEALHHEMLEIENAGRRACELTRQLLAFSRKQVLKPRVIDLHAVASGMRSMLTRLLGEDVELTILPSLALGRVLADPGQIEQVIMNLAVNARDAMPTGGKLTIEAANVELELGDHVLLAISDTGIGMDAATRARLFEPFFTTKPVGKGTGLGLATVFGIVKQSGGTVNVYSEPGEGSTFKIYLPRTDLALESDHAQAPVTTLGGSETILLVEDQDQVRMVACAILRRHGYRVLDAASGAEALGVSKTFTGTIDLLLTDVVMPRMSGPKLAEALAPLRPAMKVLFASGYTDDAIVHHGILQGGVAFVQKPFTPETLLRKVRDTIG
ncbi:hypothetical protein BH09MYX1_BH09MYX1_49200 [soil metagenome]